MSPHQTDLSHPTSSMRPVLGDVSTGMGSDASCSATASTAQPQAIANADQAPEAPREINIYRLLINMNNRIVELTDFLKKTTKKNQALIKQNQAAIAASNKRRAVLDAELAQLNRQKMADGI